MVAHIADERLPVSVSRLVVSHSFKCLLEEVLTNGRAVHEVFAALRFSLAISAYSFNALLTYRDLTGKTSEASGHRKGVNRLIYILRP